MSDFGLSSDIAKEKLHAATKLKKQQTEQVEQQEALQKQAPSQTTGLQWAFQQAALTGPTQNQKSENTNAKVSSSEPVIVAQDIEDVAMLSTTVSIKPVEVKPLQKNSFTEFAAHIIDINALQESFKECYKKSKSHNLLIERFMSHVKFSAAKTMLSLLGVSAEEQIQMQRQVREEALVEIDARLREDWAYTKAMLEITT